MSPAFYDLKIEKNNGDIITINKDKYSLAEHSTDYELNFKMAEIPENVRAELLEFLQQNLNNQIRIWPLFDRHGNQIPKSQRISNIEDLRDRVFVTLPK